MPSKYIFSRKIDDVIMQCPGEGRAAKGGFLVKFGGKAG